MKDGFNEPNIHWIMEKAREFQNNIYFFASLTTLKPFDWLDYNKLENSSTYGSTRLPYLSPEKLVCRSSSNS